MCMFKETGGGGDLFKELSKVTLNTVLLVHILEYTHFILANFYGLCVKFTDICVIKEENKYTMFAVCRL